LVAEVVYTVFALPWQIVVADGVGVPGVPTVGVTVIVAVPLIGLEQAGAAW